MPKLSDVIKGAKTKIYFQGTICRKCVLATLRAAKFGLRLQINQTIEVSFKKKKKIIFQQFRA